MKKILLALALTTALPAMAQHYNGGYYQPQPYGGQSAVYRSNTQRGGVAYNRGNTGTYQNRGRAAYNRSGMAGRRGTGRRQAQRKTFYVTPRLGGSYVNFLDGDSVSGFGVMGNVAVGMYFGQNFRADAEVGYHFKREVVNYVDYSQWDFTLNGYYDFKSRSPLTPFIGVNAGFYNQKLSLNKWADYSASETNFGLGVSGGASYQINDMMAFEGMVRGTYIFCEGNAINLDVLAGLRFSF